MHHPRHELAIPLLFVNFQMENSWHYENEDNKKKENEREMIENLRN